MDQTPTQLAIDIDAEADRRAVVMLQDRVIQQLAEQRYRTLYQQHFGKVPPPSSEAVAMGMIKGLAEEFTAAGKALDAAAYHLRERGGGKHASDAKQAAARAHEQAQGLVGGS